MRENKQDRTTIPPHHPDHQELTDWGMYGPKDRRIEQLVRELAFDHGLRLREIEAWIVLALEERLSEINRRNS